MIQHRKIWGFLILAFMMPGMLFPAVLLELRDIKQFKGSIMVGVFKSERDFKDHKQYKRFIRKATSHTMKVKINDLEPGWYMVAVFQDENENGELDSSFLGPPTEPYGFSNNARGLLGAPSFEKAKFYYKGGELSLTIQLR